MASSIEKAGCINYLGERKTAASFQGLLWGSAFESLLLTSERKWHTEGTEAKEWAPTSRRKGAEGHQIAQSQLRASVRSWRKKKTTAPSRQASPCPTWTNDIHISAYQKEWTGGVWWIAIAKGRKRHQTGSQRAGLEDCSWDKPMHKVQPPGWVLPPTWDAPGSKPTGDPQTSFRHFCHTWGINLQWLNPQCSLSSCYSLCWSVLFLAFQAVVQHCSLCDTCSEWSELLPLGTL